MLRMCLRVLLLFLTSASALPALWGTPPNLSVSPETTAILEHIYSGRADLAIPEARQMQQRSPQMPLGYLLEGEARWWKIWCASAEFKYGMTMPRHREKSAADQPYLELAGKAYALAEASIREQDSAEMRLYAAMADALAARLYGLRWESRNAARAGVRARENCLRALALDPSLADADLGLGLYNYYVDTLSTMARLMRFVMGIPGGTKAEGIRQLHRAIEEGQLTPAPARFYLAIDLENYDQRYEEALKVISPLVEKHPENALFQLVRGDLYAKLGRTQLAQSSYQAAAAAKVYDEECGKKIQMLVRQSLAGIGVSAAP
jgi:tetratricopeptide (TPR) repeat protein